MDSSEPKRRRTDAPVTSGVTAAATDETPTPTDINAALAEHARQIEALVAANRSLDAKYQARVDELEAECREKCDSLERKCGILETRCSSLERSIQVLKKDVQWTYSAPAIPRSHWIEQGHDDEYADNLEGHLRHIKEEAQAIRTGGEGCYSWSGAGHAGICGCLDNEDGQTILHDDALLPHFRELADAIQVAGGTRTNCINNIELHPSALSILFPAMEGKVTDVDMRRIRFPPML